MAESSLITDPVAIDGSGDAPTTRPSLSRSLVHGCRRLGAFITSASDWLFGAFALTVGLSVLATTPIAQFLSLGYLLESSARVARTGRLWAGFVGVRKASRVGSIAIGVCLFLLPLQLLS